MTFILCSPFLHLLTYSPPLTTQVHTTSNYFYHNYVVIYTSTRPLINYVRPFYLYLYLLCSRSAAYLLPKTPSRISIFLHEYWPTCVCGCSDQPSVLFFILYSSLFIYILPLFYYLLYLSYTPLTGSPRLTPSPVYTYADIPTLTRGGDLSLLLFFSFHCVCVFIFFLSSSFSSSYYLRCS